MSALVVPQDTPGPMYRTVTNAALLLDALAGFDAEDSYTATAVINRAPSGGSYTQDLEKNGPATIATARLGILREQCFVPDSDPKCKIVNIIVNASLIKLAVQGAKLLMLKFQTRAITSHLGLCTAYAQGTTLMNF
jgi:amidase